MQTLFCILCKFKDSHSLTTLMPRDLAEPMMLLTTFCIEMSRSLKLSSCDLTRAISYTALTVTMPAISCPEWRGKRGVMRNQQEVWLVVIEKNGRGDGVKGSGNGKKGEGERVGA